MSLLSEYSEHSEQPKMQLIDDLSTLEFQKLLLLFNAIANGWSVKQLNRNQFEFEKDLASIPNRYKTQDGSDVKDSFLFKFLRNNLSLECQYNMSNISNISNANNASNASNASHAFLKY